MMTMMTTTEVQEEAVLCKDQLQQIIKGKRTKRPRPVSPPLTIAMASSTITSSSDQASGSTTSVEPAEEEEDVAYCLMLLAQGHHHRTSKPTEPAGSDSLYVHQCKTCDRSFPSFQALGGHRASHKKPKQGDDHMNTTLSLRITHKTAPSVVCNNNNNNNNNNNKSKSKVHGCSICGAEFSSGQALGGHMRRHRTTTAAAATTTTTTTTEDHLSEKPRTVLQLDLNLPAPEDDHHHKEKKLLVFSSSNSLVDCHY